MCGFAGEISLDGPVTRARLYRMANALVHRGPDESQIAIDANARWGVAHRRLCVVDIEGGKQPMTDPERGLTLAYNGEIYEHDRLRCDLKKEGFPFKTHSDTEVLLYLYARYGVEMFEHLRGEFAFAIFDERRQKLLLARDRVGLKPLYYVRSGNRFLFASEIKSLLAADGVDRQLDPTGVIGALAVADTPGHTVFKSVRQVRHASYMEVDLQTLETAQTRYWDAWENRLVDVPASFEEQTELVRETVTHASNIRLRADVPVGAYLSGGLDSSLVACAIADKLDSIDAFALSFQESGRHDEFPYAQAVAKTRPNIRLHRIPVTHAETIRLLPDTVWHLERPFGNLHSVAKLMASRYARDYVVAVLTGDGGDEAFCGYSTYWLQDALEQCGYSLPKIRQRLKEMRKEAAKIGGNRYYLTGGLARKTGPAAAFLTEKLGFPPCDLATASDSERSLTALLHPDFRAGIEQTAVERAADYLAPTIPKGEIPHATLLQYVQLNMTVPEYIAVIADRTEWAGSVEARPPLFDHKVLELAMGLPLEAKLKGDREKHVLREAFKAITPREVIERRKQAFLAPPSPFRNPEGQALMARYMDRAAIREAGIWDERKIKWLRVASKLFPRNPLINLLLTIVATTQILHARFVQQTPR